MKNYALLKSVRVVTPENVILPDGDILINRLTGKIEKIGTRIEADQAEVLMDYEGCTAMPGFIDPHVHFRVPGKPESENWKTGSLAALFAGITTVFDMPNTNPPTVDQKGLELKLAEIHRDSLINFGIFGGLTPENLEYLIQESRVNAIKVYLASTTGDMLIRNLSRFDFSRTDKIICFHAEDEETIEANTRIYGDLTEPIKHSQIRSEEAALKSVREVIRLQKKTGGRFHIAHVSTDREIAELKDTGITFESAPHHIFCSTEKYNAGGFLWKCNPPLRDSQTAGAMLDALHTGKIPIIATDHAPHPLSAKKPETGKVPASGLPSLEIGTHLILNEVALGRLSEVSAARMLSTNAAERFSVKNRGALIEGNYADIAIVNFKQNWTFGTEHVYSNCGWSPFIGTKLGAKVAATFVNGFHYRSEELDLYRNLSAKNKIYQV